VEKIALSKSIGTKIFAALLIVAIATLAITGASLIVLSSRVLYRNISERNLQIARRASNEIDLYIADSLRELRGIAEMLAPIRDPWLQDILLENISTTLGRMKHLYLVDREGSVVADSFLSRSAQLAVDLDALAVSLGGSLYFSPVRLSENNLPYMVLSVPAGLVERRALFAELYLRDIWDLVDNISFGDGGEALLISEDGVLIAHPDKTRVLTETEALSNGELPSPPIARGESFVRERPGERDMLIAYAPVGVVAWRVIVQQPLASALLPAKAVSQGSLILLGIVLALAVLAGLFLTRRFSQPLKQLLDGTLKIRQGDLTYRISLESKDEIGRLAKSFNAMVMELQDWSERVTKSEEKYRLLTESVNDIIFSLDDSGRFVFLNRRAEVLSGTSLEGLIGRPMVDFLSPESGERFEEMIREGGGAEGGSGGLEVTMTCREERNLVLEVTLEKVFDASGGFQYYGVARDITERKRAEKRLLAYQRQLRFLASQLTLAEARERKRIAADLHNRIAQALALSRIKLGAVRAEAASVEQTKLLDEALTLIEQTIHDTRTLIFDLSSPLLYEVGLKAAIEQLAEQFQSEQGIIVDFYADGKSKPTSDDVSVLLFQAVKELLVNVVKHARARNVEITMESNTDTISIAVSDDGVGFKASETAFKVSQAGGFGLFSIQERMGQIGGSVSIESELGRGTRAVLSAPADNRL
jgi:PAS domain S-box-containing protein